MQKAQPDPHALNIAAAVQRAVAPDAVILFGSRATGQHREDSGVDLLLISPDEAKPANPAGPAIKAYLNEHPTLLEVNVVRMSLAESQRSRRAKQHLAGQADHHGVVIDPERLDYNAEYDDNYPEHWPATRQRLENATEWGKQFNDMVDEDHWNRKLMGFAAQQQVENALRGLLSAHNDPTTCSHGLDGIWNYYVNNYYDPNDPETRSLFDAVNGLMEHTTYETPESIADRLQPRRSPEFPPARSSTT